MYQQCHTWWQTVMYRVTNGGHFTVSSDPTPQGLFKSYHLSYLRRQDKTELVSFDTGLWDILWFKISLIVHTFRIYLYLWHQGERSTSRIVPVLYTGIFLYMSLAKDLFWVASVRFLLGPILLERNISIHELCNIWLWWSISGDASDKEITKCTSYGLPSMWMLQTPRSLYTTLQYMICSLSSWQQSSATWRFQPVLQK